MLVPTSVSATPQNIPSAQHLSSYQNIPMYQSIPTSPQIQEVQLTEDLLQQGEQQDEYQDDQGQAQLYDDYYEDENYGFNSLSVNKYQYPYNSVCLFVCFRIRIPGSRPRPPGGDSNSNILPYSSEFIFSVQDFTCLFVLLQIYLF